MPAERLLLVGAGHAHLHLLKNADRLRAAGYETTLLAPEHFDYSGTAVAVATGALPRDAGRVDVAALARRHGVRHLVGHATQADPRARTVVTDDGRTLDYDVVSFNIGSVAWPLGAGAGADHDVLTIKPLADLARLHAFLARTPKAGGHVVAVVGAGRSGIELAAQLAARDDVDRVTLLDGGPTFAPDLPARAAGRLQRLLERRGVRIVLAARVSAVDVSQARLASGERIVHDVVVLATGLGPPPLASAAPLGGPHGIPVRATLQHRDHDDLYAAGDCADFLPGRLPRVGVHGVRQGPVLLAALLARVAGGAPPSYRPPRRTLAVLDLGGGTALAVRGNAWWLGRGSLALKRAIDRRWLARYRS